MRLRTFTAALAVALAVTACRATPPQAPEGNANPTTLLADNTSKRISGKVIDGAGNPVESHVSLVTDNGSITIGDARGRFDFGQLRHDQYVLAAWTDDGLWAVLPHVIPGTEDIVVQPDKAGAYVDVTLTGLEAARLAIFHEGLRFSDNTLRNGRTERFLVPAGETSYLLYKGDMERKLALELAPGAIEPVRFDLP